MVGTMVWGEVGWDGRELGGGRSVPVNKPY